jgi:hypothetical protein
MSAASICARWYRLPAIEVGYEHGRKSLPGRTHDVAGEERRPKRFRVTQSQASPVVRGVFAIVVMSRTPGYWKGRACEGRRAIVLCGSEPEPRVLGASGACRA